MQFTTYRGGDAAGSLSDNEVNWVDIARNGKMWVGTSNGLNEFDPATKHFTAYDTREGMAGTFVDCVLEDKSGKLWMSTTKGISSFNPSTEIFRNFSTAEGLPGQEMTGTGGCLSTTSGRMYFAGLSGATTFLPEEIPENSAAPPTVITDFRLLGSSHSSGQKVTPQAISYASQITLSHKQTPFSLTFAALSYSDSPANRYRYKLDKLDNSWTEVGSDSRTVTYTALPAGRYRFRVQGATNSSQWSEPGAELQIVILPPWWNTWWFRTAYGSAVLLAIWFFYAMRLKQATAVIRARLGERLHERERIARELHDTLLQDFQAVILRFQLAAKRMSKGDPNRTVVEEGLDYADKVLAEGRNYIRDIRADTKADDELSKSLADYGNELSQYRPVAFSLNVIGPEFKLDPIVRDEIHGIGREAIGNAFKHSSGSNVRVEIEYKQNELELRIRDDGDGIDPDLLSVGRPGHWGIHNMKERAEKIGAKLTISSQPGSGTSLELKLPVRHMHRVRNSARRT
jgi:signal transduction histidine kinase